MEGPSLKILVDELAPLVRKRISSARGSASLPYDAFKGKVLRAATSWGKLLLLQIGDDWLKIHFLMFGSYAIDKEKIGRDPRFSLAFSGGREFNVYTSAVSLLAQTPSDLYDQRLDVLGDAWDAKLAAKNVRAQPRSMICDVLMDQTVFAGVGNIIKNEALFNLRLHPELLVGDLTPAQIRAVVKEARAYCERFKAWKLRGELKRNWLIFRKRKCPACSGAVVKESTGAGQRLSHYCPKCQLHPSVVLPLKGRTSAGRMRRA